MDKKEFVIPAKIEGRRNKRAPLGESNRKPERRSSSTGPPAERAPPGTVRARYRVKCPYCATYIEVVELIARVWEGWGHPECREAQINAEKINSGET